LPADLGLGYPEQYIKKADGAAVGVEPVAEAVIRVSLIFYTKQQHPGAGNICFVILCP